ncbi:MAG: zinc ribbon domain-containing protein [Chitinivibrionales bacterium]|nr:zinc ribbon domain-containing protein [Chitinivibrionales bacterium]
MPTYEYECGKCGRVFEQFQSITADPLKKCIFEGCDGDVRRLLSAGAGFLFKGSGFYITDYRSDSYKKAEKADRESSKSSSSSAKSDSSSSGSSSGGSSSKSSDKSSSSSS